MPYSVSGLLLRHSSSTVPSSIKARAKVSDASAGQFAILPMQLEELLTYRITDLLLRKGHVPSLRTALCFEAFRDEVRDRLLGKKPAAWTFTDISSTLRQFGGQPFINPRLAEYVPPLSYAEIEARLRNQNAVLLVGPPGTGKTMTSEIIAARSAADGVNIIREKSPEKIRDLISKSGRLLFLLSDPWGATRVDEKAPVNWTDELPKLLEFANPDKRFVITSRSDVLRTAIGDALIVEDKQPKRKYGLSSIAMRLFPEDYNSDLRRKILRNKAGRLSAWQQDFVSRHETAITRKLRLPFSIERFVSYLGQVADPANAILEDLLNSADSDTIVNTVRQQVEAWGAGQVECATVVWALLNSWNPLELELSDRLTVTLSDTGLVLELQSFLKHLLACGNIKLNGTSLEAHPKVIEALEQVLAGKPSAAAETIQKLMDAIAGPAQSNTAMASLLFDTARTVQSGRFPVQRDIPPQAKAAIFQIIENKLASKERSVFLEGLREASDFNLMGQLGMLVRQLVGESKSNDRWFRHWSRPPNTEITEEFTAWVVTSSTGLNVLRLFVEFFLPATEVTYAVQEFLGYLRSFPVDLSSSFMQAFDAVVDREQVCFNDDVIVTGSLTGEASSQHVRARILKLWESNEAWFGGFSEQLSAARECELDAEYSAHLEEEPGEHFGLVEGLAKAYVAVRRDREGWQWLTQPDNQRFISAWSEMIAEAKTTPSAEEWEALAKACRESHMSEYWSAVKAQNHWDRLADVPVETFSSRYSAKAFLEALISAVDPIAVLEQISSSLDNSSRATLVAAAAGMSTTKLEEQSNDISNQSILDVLTFGDNFMDVMLPYVTSHFEKSHMAEIQRYGDSFVPPPMGSKTQEEVFGRDFVESFDGEFGITPGRLAELGMVLLEDAIKQSATVLVRESVSLTQKLTAAGFSETETEGVWRSLVLSPRDRWNAVQRPFRDKDWFPWRYRRRLSLMTRPFVDLGDGRVVYAPGFCEDSFRHSIMECFTGAFDTGYFDTKKMKAYVGAVNARRGLDFNKSVGALFKADGWDVRLEVGMPELGAHRNDASGDVDVLAWKGNVVCVCECKELLFARNISEVADQLVRFRGLPGDDLDKHLRRVRFMQSHEKNVTRVTSIGAPRVVPLLVTSKVAPMQFTETVGTRVLSADEITHSLLATLA